MSKNKEWRAVPIEQFHYDTGIPMTEEEIQSNEIVTKLHRQMKLAKRDAANARTLYKRMSEHYVPFTDAIIKERRRLQEWKQKREMN